MKGDRPKRKLSGNSIITQTVVGQDEKRSLKGRSVATHSIVSFDNKNGEEYVDFKAMMQRGNNFGNG